MKNNIYNILKKELREMFRDKKSLSMMLIVPILIPLIVIGMSALFESQNNKDISEYNKIGFDYDLSDKEQNIASEVGIDVVYGNKEELKEQYENGDIDLYIIRENTNYIINGENNDTTTFALSLVETYFSLYKQTLQEEYLVENDVSSDEVINIITVEKNIIEMENFYASYIVSYAFSFLIMAITISATYPATDTTAGEKERGTLETLFTFPIKSRDIIIGKFLSVSLSSMITGIISLILTVISLLLANNSFTIYEGTNLMLSPISLLFVFVVIIAYSFLISGLCIAITSKSKTFKEAQSALTPLTFISVFPGMIATMINVKTNPLISLIPFLNYSLVFSDITNGIINYLDIILMLISTILIIICVLVVIIKQYKSEKALF